MKIVINNCYGGFSLSKEACEFLGAKSAYEYSDDNNRNDPRLVECVETLGDKANGDSARLHVVEIPDDVDWYIDEYDGIESIHERHRIWY